MTLKLLPLIAAACLVYYSKIMQTTAQKLIPLLFCLALFACAKQQTVNRLINDPNIVIMEQPEQSELKQMRAKNISSVVNFRTNKEIESLPFNEAKTLQEQGVHFYTIEIGKDRPYSPQKLLQFNQIMEQNKGHRVVIHCRSGHRAAQVYAAWLIRYRGLSNQQATAAISPRKAQQQAIKQLLEQPNNGH